MVFVRSWLPALAIFAATADVASGQAWLQQRQPPVQPVPPGGATTPDVSGSVNVGSAKVALPPGTWTLAAEEMRTGSSAAGGTISDKIQQKIFFQTENGRIASIVSISANVGYNNNGWVSPRACQRRDVVYTHNESEYSHSFDCLHINHQMAISARATTRSGVWSLAYDRVAKSARIPEQLVMAEFNCLSRNRGSFVTVIVYFNPELSGFISPDGAWLQSPWHKSRLDATHAAYIDGIARWAENYRTVIRAAWD